MAVRVANLKKFRAGLSDCERSTIVTNHAAFGYLADVFVLEPQRGRGLGKWLIETVLAHPDLQGLRRITLGTQDAHSLYERYGFKPADSARLMTLDRPAKDLYGN